MKKVLQFGEGNFLRCFVQYKMQESKENGAPQNVVDVVSPIPSPIIPMLKKQNYEYHTVVRGKMAGEVLDEIKKNNTINSAVDPFEDFEGYKSLYMDKDLGLIISNTTEAGIVFSSADVLSDSLKVTFPAKITKILLDRFGAYGNDGGLDFICVELIDNNAKMLKECILQYIKLWGLPADFEKFVQENNTFNSTLVDRIVTGHPKDMQEFNQRLGYLDNLLVVGEPYFLWVIEGKNTLADKYPFLTDDHIIFTDDMSPYRERKVKILNGSHSMIVSLSLLAGIEYVGDAMTDPQIRGYLEKVLESEVMQTIDLPKAEMEEFKNSIFERFENPFVKHSFWAIALNTVSKWKTRDLCSVIDFVERKGELPKGMLYSLAGMIAFYLQNIDVITDDESVMEFFKTRQNTPIEDAVKDFISSEEFMGQDLTKIAGLEQYVATMAKAIMENGVKATIDCYNQ